MEGVIVGIASVRLRGGTVVPGRVQQAVGEVIEVSGLGFKPLG